MMWDTPVSSCGGVDRQKAKRFSVVRREVQDLAAGGGMHEVPGLDPVLRKVAPAQELEGTDDFARGHCAMNIRIAPARVHAGRARRPRAKAAHARPSGKSVL
jgi:hypothetical protein